jgi:hypothetical protein
VGGLRARRLPARREEAEQLELRRKFCLHVHDKGLDLVGALTEQLRRTRVWSCEKNNLSRPARPLSVVF